ncbi:UDP-N-acetyl-D-glucosamine 6-dehydrogenase [Porphyridium purpureum]|uniref:UDP-N-acetyl-D-glucosamine 6-dehydrogenase n=1 Tax=Porphyridium purpureum TaxID=35688 RepID=A0A5J4YLK4_PORPP|nr:UDP-N-acetyl-D-glucosamine 6-dehydrogenase [Porphyridium purpureum]|eukprot:POR3088..scf210_14
MGWTRAWRERVWPCAHHRQIDKLQRAHSYIVYIPQDTWDKLSQSAQFEPTDDFERLREVDVFVICLPTPVGPHNEPDLQYVFGAVQTIAAKMKPGSLVILESTTYPGTTDTDVVALLRDNVGAAWLTERTAPVLGENFFVAFSPEREDPANQMFAYETIPKLVGGVCATSGALAAEFYKQAGFATPVLVESARVAECAKLVENIYRSVNIALVNELKVVFEAMDVNIWSVLDAAQTKPFGFHRFNPGPGVGGHCIGVDPFYLSWKAKEFGQNCDFVQLAARVNASMPDFVVGRVAAALNELGRALNGSRVLLIGVAFKADVDDMRGSPSLEVWERLRKGGALVSYYDPMISVIPPTREHRLLMGQESVTWNRESIDGHDCLVLLTNHSQIDYSILKSYSGVVVDTRNAVPKDLDIRVVQA